MTPGQILTLRSRDRIRVWQVQGVYLGALGQENVIGLTPLDLDCPDTPERQHELFVPLRIIQEAFPGAEAEARQEGRHG